jgi:hypothetical protein
MRHTSARSRKVADYEVLAPGNPAWLAWTRNPLVWAVLHPATRTAPSSAFQRRAGCEIALTP